MTTTAASRTVRDRLIDAAEVCMRAKGIRSTTVSEVAEVAGVSRGWLYRHFPDKASLLGAAIVRLTEEFWSEAHVILEQVGGPGSPDRRRHRQRRKAVRRSGRIADEAARRRTRGIRRVRRAQACRAWFPIWPTSGPGIWSPPGPRRGARRYRHRRGIGMGCAHSDFTGHRARRTRWTSMTMDAVLAQVHTLCACPGLRRRSDALHSPCTAAARCGAVTLRN